MAVQKETFGREIVRPEREVEFKGSEIAAFIQSQFRFRIRRSYFKRLHINQFKK